MNLGDKVLGAIIGGAIGDAYGSAFEGRKGDEVSFDRAVWRLSDDTQQWNGENNILALVVDSLPDTLLRDRLKAIDESNSGYRLRDIALRFGCSGFAVESVPLALCGANCIRAIGFTNMIEEVIACGGDTDTTASIAGQVAVA